MSYRIFACVFLSCSITLASGVARPPSFAPLPEDVFPGLKVFLEEALKQSPTMLQKNLELAQAEAARYMNSAARYPSVSSGISYNINSSSPSESTGVESTSDGLYYSMNVYQPIYHWGALKAQSDSAKIGVKISEKNYAEAYRTLTLNIRSQFLALVVLKMRENNAAFALKVARDTLALNEERLKKGTVSPGEIIPLRLAKDEARLALDQITLDFEYARNFFARTVGLASVPVEDIPGEVPVGPLQFDAGILDREVGHFMDDGVENTNTALKFSWAIDQSNLNYKIQKYRLFPKLGFSASVSQSNSTSATPTSVSQTGIYSESVNLTVSWNIFDGFSTRGAKMSALASKRSSERSLRNYLEATRSEAGKQKQLLVLAYRRMQIGEVRRDLSLGAVKKANDDMERGFASQGDVDLYTVNLNIQTLLSTHNRVAFLNRSSELHSLIDVDPNSDIAPANLSAALK